MKLKTRICLAIALIMVTLGLVAGIYVPKSNVLSCQHSRSVDGKHTISVISVRGDGGIDYQILRYIVAKDTNNPPKSKQINRIVLPDSGGVKVVWFSPKEVHLFTEECCEYVVRGRKGSLCGNSLRLPEFDESLDLILHSKVDYDNGPKEMTGADVNEL